MNGGEPDVRVMPIRATKDAGPCDGSRHSILCLSPESDPRPITEVGKTKIVQVGRRGYVGVVGVFARRRLGTRFDRAARAGVSDKGRPGQNAMNQILEKYTEEVGMELIDLIAGGPRSQVTFNLKPAYVGSEKCKDATREYAVWDQSSTRKL